LGTKSSKIPQQFTTFKRYLDENDKIIKLGEGGITMTLTIFFFTISIKKRELSLEEDIHREVVERRMQENVDRNFQMMGRY
jgi:uncharacterized protein (TIGR02413 family)